MKIKISNLIEGTHDFTFQGPLQDLGFDKSFSGDFRLEVCLEKTPHQLILTADGELSVKMECDRCGTEYQGAIPCNFRLVFLAGAEEQESENDSIKYITRDTDEIDFGDDAHDFATLAIPMKKLCKHDCKGLCHSCGKDLNSESCECSQNVSNSKSPFGDLKKLYDKLN
jgi:uncharacterized protein